MLSVIGARRMRSVVRVGRVMRPILSQLSSSSAAHDHFPKTIAAVTKAELALERNDPIGVVTLWVAAG